MWFTQLMFELLPGYNKFRTVSMTLVVLEWTAPLLNAMPSAYFGVEGRTRGVVEPWRGRLA